MLEKACVLVRPWWRFLSETRGEGVPVMEYWRKHTKWARLLCSLPPLLLTPEGAFTESISGTGLV